VMLGAFPGMLTKWMGHKNFATTQEYIHLAEAHAREIPENVVLAGQKLLDPTKRVFAMLGARADVYRPTEEAANGLVLKLVP
jgi:hypothetical protein